ncbi:hypothetical protein [Legionella sp. km772]|uniref:hypothetical protein n=1 Tax=Legionella sp. km772 TaxID=2498111 RepID=UPI000F8ED176|nr:hypothetical protein [Legionella sp. km772]RUR08457.1 hypothetical protein ELY15_10845 [Legionella sp. km772]
MGAKDISHKTTLLLDLDETVYVALTEQEFDLHGATYESIKKYKHIHPSHDLSAGIKIGGFYFFVLNPELLKTMIEKIYAQQDDIIIFTAGLWLPPILEVISRLCDLHSEDAVKFKGSLFLNPQHDSEKLGYSMEATRTLAKAYRLHSLFRSMEVLRRRHFILLDNDSLHISSCGELPYIQGIRATTDSDDKSFYELVLKAMALSHAGECALSPASPAYYFPQAILKTLIALDKSSLNETATLSVT